MSLPTLLQKGAPMPLKVCLYISTLGPGGAERQIVTVAGELARRGTEVYLLHAQKNLQDAAYLQALEGLPVEIVSVLSPEYLQEGIKLSRLHEKFFKCIPGPGSGRMGILYLAGAFSRCRPDVVHSYLGVSNCIAGCASVLAETPVHVASFRNVDPKTFNSDTRELTHTLYIFLLENTSIHLEAKPRAGAEHYARWLSISTEAIAYAPNGLDPAVCRGTGPAAGYTLRRELGIRPDASVLLSLARFHPNKAPGAMLDIFARVLAARPDCHYLIAGAGMEAQGEMGALVRERGLEGHVHLLGVRSDVAPLLACADVFLLPSRIEGFPNAPMEAMAARVPVMASNVGGIHDLVREGRDGFLHDAEDVDGMAQSVLRLMADADMRARFGRDASRRIETEFSVQKLGERALKKYAELLSGSRHGTPRCRGQTAETLIPSDKICLRHSSRSPCWLSVGQRGTAGWAFKKSRARFTGFLPRPDGRNRHDLQRMYVCS